MKDKLTKAICGLSARPVVLCALIAVLLTFLIEILSKGSLAAGAVFLGTHPLMFLYNTAIIMLTLMIALLFPFRQFLMSAVSLCWLTLGVVNCVLMHLRSTPLSAIDFTVIRSAYSLLDIYLDTFQMVLIVAIAVLAVGGMVLVLVKAPRTKPQYSRVIPAFIAVAAAVIAPMNTVIRAQNITEKYPDISEAYENYGFACCFTYSIFNTGIDKPADYNRTTVKTIINGLDSGDAAEPAQKPNIVMVQLESFFDPTLIAGVEYAEDPVPVFRNLKNTCSSGFLHVPVVGGGTANTEFEVITGMSTEFFGIGEYPYKTTLLDRTCESANYNLKSMGYTAHALHNHTGTFYDRNIVYANLGFDTFTSAEYMEGYETNALGWMKDMALKDEIQKAMASTRGTDFVYAVSVQCHGKYPSEPIEGENTRIQVFGVPGNKHNLEYYINQAKEVDDFIAALIEELARNPEPVVLVLFGDHQPCLEMGEYELKNGDLFDTEYVIWANFPMEKEDKDLEAFQLTAQVMKRLGMSSGVFTKLHQAEMPETEYKKDLKILQYDALFGGKYAWKKAFVKTDMQMGIIPVTVSAVTFSDGYAQVHGANFTSASRVVLDGKEKETEFVSPALLRVKEEQADFDGRAEVEQVTQSGKALSVTKGIHVP